eukprot:3047703-Amphidinium_carterae.1
MLNTCKSSTHGMKSMSVQEMETITAHQRDVDMLNLSHVRNILKKRRCPTGTTTTPPQQVQTYMSESSAYLVETTQLQQGLKQMTELNQHTGAAQANSDWTLRTELQNDVRSWRF